MERSPSLRVGWPARLVTLTVVAAAVLVPSRGGDAPADGSAASPAAPAVTIPNTEPTATAAGPSSAPSTAPAVAAETTPSTVAAPEGSPAAMPSPVPQAAPAPITEPAPPIVALSEPSAVTEALTAAVAAGPAAEAEAPVEPALVAVVEDDTGGLSVERIVLDETTDLAAVADEIVADGRLVAASMDAMVFLDEPEVVADGGDPGVGATATNDAYRSQQWALDQVPFEAAWGRTSGSGVIVAVIDTAVDLGHSDLAGQIVSPYHFLSTGAGPGMSTVPPGNFHGTHVAGIIAAVASNGIGIAGGAPGVRIMPIEVLATNGGGRYSDIVSAIIHAADQGAKVINLSLGGSSQSSALDAAVAYAVSRGAAVMAAAGNDYCTVGVSGCPTNYPAASPGAIGIGSITSSLTCSAFTTRGPHVDLGAPGSSIISLAPPNLYGSGYVTASGTSMATPYAAAAAGIVMAAAPAATPAQVLSALQTSAVDVVDPGFDSCTGSGLVDPLAALDELGSLPPSPPTTTVPTSLGAPRLAGALAGRSMVRLSFVVPDGATFIRIRRDGVVIDTISAARRSYTDRSISPRTQYTYEVNAYSDRFGDGPISNARQVTTRG